MKFVFVTDCVSSTDVLIRPMIDSAKSVTFETFAKRCDWRELAKRLGYSVGSERGLHIKDDYHVSFHKSTFNGRACYYVRWSAIEHIFQEPQS